MMIITPALIKIELWTFLDQTFTKFYDLSRRLPISSVTNTILSCDPVCQIRKISSLFGILGYKQNRILDLPGILRSLFEKVYWLRAQNILNQKYYFPLLNLGVILRLLDLYVVVKDISV